MSHELESGFFGSSKPAWHGLGNVLPGQLTTAEAITAAGLDWQVSLEPVFAQIDGVMTPTVHKATVRSSDKKVLGVVGAGYRPLQNIDAFAVIDPIIANGSAVWETAGSLWGGKATWALAKLPSDIVIRRPGGVEDPVRNYLLVTNRHDGSASVQVKLTPIRVVCQNTLTLALRGGAFKVSHVGDMEARIRTAADALGLANKLTAEMQEAFQAMADYKMDDKATMAYLKRCLRQTRDTGDQSEADVVQASQDGAADEALPKRLNKLLELTESGRGAELCRGTLWGAYNACTELADHGSNWRAPENRAASVLLDIGVGQLKVRAFRNAMELVSTRK